MFISIVSIRIVKSTARAVAFASRLKPLLNYYLESRHVDDFDGLFELLICDRIKRSLLEACLRHVLSVENATESGWLNIVHCHMLLIDMLLVIIITIELRPLL